MVRIHPPPPARHKRQAACDEFFHFIVKLIARSFCSSSLSQRVTLGLPVRLQAPSRRRAAAANFLRDTALLWAAFLFFRARGETGWRRPAQGVGGAKRVRRFLSRSRWRFLPSGPVAGRLRTGEGHWRTMGGRAVNRTYVLFTALLYLETAPLSRGKLEVSKNYVYCRRAVPIAPAAKRAPPSTGKAARQCFC